MQLPRTNVVLTFLQRSAMTDRKLSIDITRCGGRIVQQKIPGQQTAITISHGQAQCLQCLRRTAERGEHVLMMEPPQFVDGKCPARIEP